MGIFVALRAGIIAVLDKLRPRRDFHTAVRASGEGVEEDEGNFRPKHRGLHYGFVDAHRDLNLAIQRRNQK